MTKGPWRRIQVLWRVRRHHRPDTVALNLTLLAALAALAAPLAVHGFGLFQLSSAGVYALALAGLNLLSGYNGQLSLGHGAFFGIGAFATAIAMTRWHVPYPLAIAFAGTFCFATGLLFGIPALRLERISLALATFALAVAMPQVFFHFDDWTGGSMGLSVTKAAPPGALASLGTDAWLYYLVTLTLIAALFAISNLASSRHGRAIRAVRDKDIASAAMGVHNEVYKVICFGLSALLTGVAGGFSALLVGNVAPETFSAGLSITFLTGIVVGGLGSLFGPVFGGLFIQYLPNYTENISKALTSAVYGVILIVFMYGDPNGISGVLTTVRARAKEFFSYFKF